MIDDDPIACEHAKLILEEIGIEADSSLNGADAIEKVRLHHARQEAYNLILVDWKMPEQDGIEVTKKIREIVGDDSAIIILTAYSWDDVIDEALAAGVDSFMAKPLFVSGIMDEFNRAIQKKNTKSHSRRLQRLIFHPENSDVSKIHVLHLRFACLFHRLFL